MPCSKCLTGTLRSARRHQYSSARHARIPVTVTVTVTGTGWVSFPVTVTGTNRISGLVTDTDSVEEPKPATVTDSSVLYTVTGRNSLGTGSCYRFCCSLYWLPLQESVGSDLLWVSVTDSDWDYSGCPVTVSVTGSDQP